MGADLQQSTNPNLWEDTAAPCGAAPVSPHQYVSHETALPSILVYADVALSLQIHHHFLGLVGELNGAQVQYGYLSVVDPNTELTKYVIINWAGDAASTAQKGALPR